MVIMHNLKDNLKNEKNLIMENKAKKNNLKELFSFLLDTYFLVGPFTKAQSTLIC